jgi:hypothetical protein
VLLLVAVVSAPPGDEAAITFPAGDAHAETPGIRKVLEVYVRAVSQKDVALFRSVKPNMTEEEERRAKAAFKSVQSQVVRMNVLALDVKAQQATVRVARRDTLNGSIVSSFPQTFLLARTGAGGWVIQDIGR